MAGADPRQWPGFRDDLDSTVIEYKRGKSGRPLKHLKSDSGRAAADRGDQTYPSAVSTREQTPAFRARRAVKEIGDRRKSQAIRGNTQAFLAERLVQGKTNGTLNHHIMARIARFVKGGRNTVLAHIELAARNGNAEARAWWMVFSELLPSQQRRVDMDDVCEAAGVPPDQIMAVIVSTAIRAGQDAADYMAAVAHPEIVHQTIKSALRISGPHALVAQKDRELMLGHGKFLPDKGRGTTVNVNANAHAEAQAAAASQPSVPTFTESLRAPIAAQRVVQGQLVEHVEAD